MEGMTPTKSDVRPDGPAAVVELAEPSLDRLPGYAAALDCAREVLAAVAQEANSLPPVLRQAEALEAARAEAEAARVEEVAARAGLADEGQAVALARAEAGKRGREEEAQEHERAVQDRADALRGVLPRPAKAGRPAPPAPGAPS